MGLGRPLFLLPSGSPSAGNFRDVSGFSCEALNRSNATFSCPGALPFLRSLMAAMMSSLVGDSI